MNQADMFVGKVTLKSEFEFKIFYTLHIQHVVLHVKIWYILYLFTIFNY
jgi:hypothetical protein